MPDDYCGEYHDSPLHKRVQQRRFQAIRCKMGYHIALRTKYTDERNLPPICIHCGNPLKRKPQ